MGALFASDFWPDNLWPEGFFGDPDLGVVADPGYWTPNFWLDTFWPENFWYDIPSSAASGSLAVTLGDDDATLIGDYNSASSGPRNGILSASLFGVTGSLGGTIAYITNFDLEVGISVNWQLLDLPVLDGSIAATLDELTSSISGVAWENSYTDGFIGPTETLWAPMFWDWRLFPDGYWPKSQGLEDLTAAFSGAFSDIPANRAGFISVSLEALTASLEGWFTERQQFNGQIAVTLDGATAALTGDVERPQFSGAVAATLDGVGCTITGVVTPAGSFNGRLRSTLTGVAGQLRGTYEVPVRYGDLAASLEGVTAYGWGIAVPDGAKVGQVQAILSGVNMVGAGTFVTPRLRSRAETPSVTEIDWKTLCDQHNLGLPDDVDYEFSSGRRFYQS